jgi:hypothetical protein
VADVRGQIYIDFVKALATQFKMLSGGYLLQFAIPVLDAMGAIKPVVA